MIRLINTIEINPLKYARENPELPEISDYPDPEEWFRKWEEAASALNRNFKVIGENSNLVDIDSIDDENLQMILEKVDNWSSAFDGGIIMMENDKIRIEPKCCGDLGNITEWHKIFDDKTSDWTEMWIGHPWIFYRKQKAKVQFSEYSYVNLKEIKGIEPIFEVDEAELKNEFQKVKQYQIHFKNRIATILKRMSMDKADEISALLTGIK
ncbi:hypothetical protein FY557_18745 [Chryseobacterium sp. SN22]|uniref:hypothetical protein n=1 Tax=Chryseobacterium sp. SN22 TaxID=2606431 RepID=UPI0011EF0156|nr:hypothetical protein [Chryseobacterium sp. SN22]KAA0126203.1 hypothetical protein FY557_18745 [Chryseobacterium sp. SN22]